MSKILDFLKAYRTLLLIIFIPLISANLPAIIQTNEAYCGFALIVMSLYWITECIPYAITSLLPVIIFPMFGIMSSKEVALIYFQDIIMLFLGGLVLATCVEESNLHKRIAFRVILLFGTNPVLLLLGMMFVTWFLSLWISNTASTAMMLPIVVATCTQITKLNSELDSSKVHVEMIKNKENESPIEMTEIGGQIEDKDKKVPVTRLLKGFIIGISYSASIGGCGSLVGTTPNLILKGFYDNAYPDAGLNFFTYMLYSLPAAFLMLIFSWISLSLTWLPIRKIFSRQKTDANKKKRLHQFIQNEYDELGPVSWEQGSVGGLFLILVVLWVTRDLFFVPGWGSLFKKDYVTDTTPAIIILFCLVVWPKNNIFKGHTYEPLITWKKINETFPWNILLLGGGLGLAKGFDVSGLSKLIGEILRKIIPEQKELALLIVMVFSLTGTELISNTSMASIFIPIASKLADNANINASYLLLPLTITASYAFILPVSTPPNTIIFSTGYVTIKDLAISGFILKFLGIAVMYLSTLWVDSVFNDTRIFNTTLATVASNSTLGPNLTPLVY